MFKTKEAKVKYAREYYQKHRAEMDLKTKQWQADHRSVMAKRLKRWRKRNPEKAAAERKRHIDYQLKWQRDNPEKRRLVSQRYYQKIKKPPVVRVLAQTKLAIYCRYRRKTDIEFALVGRLRATTNRAFRRNFVKKSKRTLELVGCSPLELRAHIQSLFLPGMTMENRHLWHVDHKIPLDYFDLRDPAQQRAACHYTNLQPLWAKDNQRKSNKC